MTDLNLMGQSSTAVEDYEKRKLAFCEITTCPLHKYRPFSSKDAPGEPIEELEL